jgi:Tol biopolymer transport system component
MAPFGVRAAYAAWILWPATTMLACTPFRDDPASGTTTAVPCDPSWVFSAPRPVRGLENVGTSIGGLRLSPDSLTGYFHAMGVSGSVGLDDLYVATRRSVDSPFEQVTPLNGINVNTSADEHAPTVSGDGLTLVFSRAPENPPGPGSLFVTTRATPDASFLLASPLPVQDVTMVVETPFLLPSGTILYFASTPAGVESMPAGPLAIYSAALRDGGFDAQAPIPFVATASPAFNGWYPAVSPDIRTLYFATNRSTDADAEDYDVWVATRQSSADPFSMPTAVPEVNSRMADVPTFVTADGCTLYLSSNRSGAYAMYVANKEPLPSADGAVETSP